MGKRRAVERDLSGPSTMMRVNHKDRAQWISKYEMLGTKAIEDAGYDFDQSGLPLLSCVNCKVAKERTTDFYTANNVNGDLDKWFSRPFPSLCNYAGRPCNACHALTTRVRDRDVEGGGWLRSLLHRYELPTDWAIYFYTLPAGAERCWATGGTLNYMKGSNSFSLSVNSTVVQTKCKYSQKKSHAIEDLVAVYQFANCRQTVPGPNGTKTVVIPSLRDAWTELYRRTIEAYRVGRVEMDKRGDEQVMKMKRKADFHKMVQSAKLNDSKRGLDNDMSSLRVLDTVRGHHGICSITGIITTTFSASGGVRGPFDVHLDRIDDAYSLKPKGHVADNIELKIRLLNNTHQITRKDFLMLFLNQVLEPVPEYVRQLARAEYDTIPCNVRDAWRHSD